MTASSYHFVIDRALIARDLDGFQQEITDDDDLNAATKLDLLLKLGRKVRALAGQRKIMKDEL